MVMVWWCAMISVINGMDNLYSYILSYLCLAYGAHHCMWILVSPNPSEFWEVSVYKKNNQILRSLEVRRAWYEMLTRAMAVQSVVVHVKRPSADSGVNTGKGTTIHCGACKRPSTDSDVNTGKDTTIHCRARKRPSTHSGVNTGKGITIHCRARKWPSTDSDVNTGKGITIHCRARKWPSTDSDVNTGKGTTIHCGACKRPSIGSGVNTDWDTTICCARNKGHT